jgi:phosphoserine phosphatase
VGPTRPTPSIRAFFKNTVNCFHNAFLGKEITTHPKIKLVCFDLDQTLINENSWSELSLALSVSKELDDQLYGDFKQGKITYDEWNDRVLAEYMKHENATRTGVSACFSKYTLANGAREAVDYVKNAGYQVALISGSIDVMVNLVAKDLGIRFAKANNTFIFDEKNQSSHRHSCAR